MQRLFKSGNQTYQTFAFVGDKNIPASIKNTHLEKHIE